MLSHDFSYRRSVSLGPLALGIYIALLALLAANPAQSQVIAKPDQLLAVSKQVRVIEPSELMANDEIGEFATVVIDSLPIYGQLATIRDAEGTRYEYVSDWVDGDERPFYGQDQFTYRLVGDIHISSPTTVFVTVRPRWIPVSGRWLDDGQVVGPNELGDYASQDDQNEEPSSGGLSGGLGFYNSAESYFRLCELVETLDLENCEDFALPSSHATLGLYPVIGDWDSDPQDEVGVYDSRQGRILFFDLERQSCAFPGPQTCLRLIAELPFGKPGDQLLVGDWGSPDVAGDQFGVYEPSSGWARLGPGFEQETAGWHFEYLLGQPGLVEGQAVVGQWREVGPETAAFYNGTTGWVDIALDNSSSDSLSFLAQNREGPLLGGVAFAATTFNERARFFGVFVEHEATTYLFATARWGAGQVLVRVPTDPDGGCCR